MYRGGGKGGGAGAEGKGVQINFLSVYPTGLLY